MRVRWATEVTGTDLKEIVNEVVFAANQFFGSQVSEDQREAFLESLMERADIDITRNAIFTSGQGATTSIDYRADVVIAIDIPTGGST